MPPLLITQTCALSSCALTTQEPRGSARRCYPSGTGSDRGPPGPTFSDGRLIEACRKAQHRIFHTSCFKAGFRTAGSASADRASCALWHLQKYTSYYTCLSIPSTPLLAPRSGPLLRCIAGVFLSVDGLDISCSQILVSSACPPCSLDCPCFADAPGRSYLPHFGSVGSISGSAD